MKKLFLFPLAMLLLLSMAFATQSSYEGSEAAPASVSFTLRNTSAKSIPLLIPGVMNPNLSPISNSGVTLKVGQEILFRYKGKKRVLLVVGPELEGQTLKVPKLLSDRKKEIDEERKPTSKK